MEFRVIVIGFRVIGFRLMGVRVQSWAGGCRTEGSS